MQLKATSCQGGNICSGEVWAGITSQVLGQGANMHNEAKKESSLLTEIPSWVCSNTDTAPGNIIVLIRYILAALHGISYSNEITLECFQKNDYQNIGFKKVCCI